MSERKSYGELVADAGGKWLTGKLPLCEQAWEQRRKDYKPFVAPTWDEIKSGGRVLQVSTRETEKEDAA